MLNVTLAQVNPVVGDLEGNARKVLELARAKADESHLVVFPELVLSGYPPEDLLTQRHFLLACREVFNELVNETKGLDCLLVLGLPYYEEDCYNALAVVYDGKLLGLYFKERLPNYGVFDEKRYFREGRRPLLGVVNGVKVGFSVCEDAWYPDGPERYEALSGAQVIVNVNASPYQRGKYAYKERFLRARAQDNAVYFVYVNAVGGQDELVFDGRSLVIGPEGELVARAKAFEEDALTVTLEPAKCERVRLVDLRWREASKELEPLEPAFELGLPKKRPAEGRLESSPEGAEELYAAIKLAVRDYADKNGFKGAVVGLSGGIDSSLVACVAADALGPRRVVGVYMPSPFSSKESYEDAERLARSLGIEFLELPVDGPFEAYLKTLKERLGELPFSVAEENLQARIRANYLFYLSNRYGYLVLATSNKSETAVGYTTIYGDMAGGYAPIKDLYKTQVYELARYRNGISPVIPERVFEKPPSAELRPGQTDQDTLPPYELLDGILMLYLEEGLSPDEIAARGFERELVLRVVRMVRASEYKRKQAPLGPKLSKRAFGKDWRMPVTNRFKL
ncbi:MAG: NAD+ synthase [Aquificae bacterium]|nr:NAD+ synthase [Aquificota bacterium]